MAVAIYTTLYLTKWQRQSDTFDFQSTNSSLDRNCRCICIKWWQKAHCKDSVSAVTARETHSSQFLRSCDRTCFGQFLCPSSGVYSLYTRHWYISYSFEESFRVEPGWNCPSSGVYSLYTRHWYISYSFEESFRVEPGWNCPSSGVYSL